MKQENEQKFINMLSLSIRAGSTSLGTQACTDDLKKGRIRLLIVDSSASDETSDRMKDKCRYRNVKCLIWDGKPLSECFSKPTRIFGVRDENFALELMRIYNM